MCLSMIFRNEDDVQWKGKKGKEKEKEREREKEREWRNPAFRNNGNSSMESGENEVIKKKFELFSYYSEII